VNRAGKTLLVCASLAPLCSAIGIGSYVAYEIIATDLARPASPPTLDPVRAITESPFGATELAVFAAIALGIGLLELVLSAFLTLHAVRDPRLRRVAIAMWVVAFFVVGPFALPAYVLIYVVREPPPKRVAALDQSPIAP